ncbi:MAG: TetR/AcrR family transcriptional regulator [Polyangiaceae bacterium]
MPPTETRERILAAARDVYAEVGALHFSLREVARRTGVTAAAIYRHFEGKEALLSAVCDEGFRVFTAYLVRSLAAPTPRERLLTMADEYLHFGLERPRDYRVIFMTEPGELLSPRDVREAPVPPSFQLLVDRVVECMTDGTIAPGDPAEVAVTVWAHVHGLLALHLSGHLAPFGDEAAFQRIFRASTRRLVDGLRP